MKRFIENIPLLTISLIFIGYCNLWFYYRIFHIDIRYYINTSEILLSLWPLIMILSTHVFVQLMAHAADISDLKTLTSTPRKNILPLNWKIFNMQGFSYLAICFLFFLIGGFLVYKAGHNIDDLKTYYIIFIFAFVALTVLLIYAKEKIQLYPTTFIYVLAVLFIGTVLGGYQTLDAIQKRTEPAKEHISFRCNKTIINSSPNLVYIGQTQSHLFMFNKTQNATVLFRINAIDSLVIK